ncbi:sterile alpha motif domain-containing protein 9-like [Oncorhynchus masou masou]|uniref:sterile alpha motif domain-containing protein 9-like n=1 Tax=Oncorhynchus masou masou TaxID=90313 RepID=UPI003183835A
MAGKVIPTLPNAGGGVILMDSELMDSLSFLDVLSASEFEGEQIDPAVALETETDFYKGTPPKWMNFYLADERANSDSSATPTGEERDIECIRRDGYEKLRELIKLQRQGSWSVNSVKLLHQPGSGGTTLAMQILWDLRKELRCAILVDPSSDKKDMGKQVQKDPLSDTRIIAKQVVELFATGDPENQNTVLLLQDNEHLRDHLQDFLIREITEQKISAKFPVVIVLQCIRSTCIIDDEEDESRTEADLLLKSRLSDKEKTSFVSKEKLVQRHHRDEMGKFHGFNIMQNNFNEEYMRKTFCSEEGKEIIKYLQQNKVSRNTKLFAFLALVNSYVPGSYLLQSQCEAFFSHQDPFGVNLSFEKRMQPFSDLIVTFSRHGGEDKRVRIAHPVLAHQCVQLLADAGIARSSATLDFLQYLTRQQIQPSLLLFFKDMLTKRETTSNGQEIFSRLILDIEKHEGIPECANVLKTASETFKHDPFYPQSLARFYYIKMSDFTRAEIWAEKAKERVPTNSFIADTLGQVHKNHLYKQVNGKSGEKTGTRDILFWAEKAIKAFKQEEELAERESVNHMEGDSPTKMSHTFNNRGIFGYLQVANIVYDSLTNLNPRWRKILTQEISAERHSILSEDRKLMKYQTFITSLRVAVERKFYNFFESYLTYSEPRNWKDQTPYFQRDIVDCFCKYTSAPSPKEDLPLKTLKEKMASTFPGLSTLNRNANLSKITELWKIINKENPDDVNTACNYILANILQTNGPVASPEPATLPQLRAILQKFMEKENTKLWTPEFYLLVLLLFWPEEAREGDVTNDIDLNKYVECMKQAFDNKYKKYLQSRELVPLFYLGKGAGLKRLVHKSSIDDICVHLKKRKSRTPNKTRGSAEISCIQDHLLRVNGVVRVHKAFARMADKEIEICPQKQASVWKDGNISFYLGFNISGPQAFDIKYTMPTVGSGGNVQKQRDDAIGSEGTRMEESKTLNRGIPKGLKTSSHIHTPTLWTEPGLKNIHPQLTKTHYRLQCPRAGLFQCRLTGLMFLMEGEGEVLYRTVQWDDSLLHSTGRTPAGPLFSIECPRGSVRQLHLPHCEISSGKGFDSLSVAHVTGDSVEVLQPVRVTDSHAVVDITDLSIWGLLSYIFPSSVKGQVLLFHKPQLRKSTLNVHLLPVNVPVTEVEKLQRACRYIQIPSNCPLTCGETYKLCCDSATKSKIQPLKETFHSDYGPNHHPTFQVFLEAGTEDVELRLLKRGDEEVWIRQVPLTDIPPDTALIGGQEVYAKDQLMSVRQRFVETVSESNIKSLLDGLLQKNVINDCEIESVNVNAERADKARAIIKMVINKGNSACLTMKTLLCELDQCLCSDLGLS